LEKKMIFQTKAFQIAVVISAAFPLFTSTASAQSAPNAPQYRTGTTNIPTSSLLPRGSTTGTALNGNTQLSVPLSNSNTYVYGQNASTAPSRGQPASMGGVIGVGRTF
jgi:hypothetical protein